MTVKGKQIPRYRDGNGNAYEIFLMCGCGWSVTKDKVTSSWATCPLCDGKLEAKRSEYPGR